MGGLGHNSTLTNLIWFREDTLVLLNWWARECVRNFIWDIDELPIFATDVNEGVQAQVHNIRQALRTQ